MKAFGVGLFGALMVCGIFAGPVVFVIGLVGFIVAAGR